jgi:hypothetical protein
MTAMDLAMEVDDVLALATDGLGSLHSPVMVIALTGLFDVGGAATAALDSFAPNDTAITIGEIDADPFYDFTQERPYVEIDEGEIRVIRWPQNSFEVVRAGGQAHSRDLIVLVGVEPHLYWPTYSACIRRVVTEVGCEAVVTVGATAEAVPHTRTPIVTGSTTDPALARALGIGQPSYQGPTGVVGVIQTDLAAAGVPSVSLRVGVPHYLMNAEHPLAVHALRTHLAHVLGIAVPPDETDIDSEIARWRDLHDEVVAGDVQLQMYVRMLEHDHDRRAEAAIPSADDLADQFEAFLRDHRDQNE